MRDILVRIKRAVLAGRYAFSEKARTEMEADRLTEADVRRDVVSFIALSFSALASVRPEAARTQ
jgi:hypothetical protein